MHHNYYFLKKLSKALSPLLVGKHLLTAFSQNKDELVIGFSNPQHEELYIRATLTLDFSCLNISEEFHRAKRNSINLFQDIIDEKVLAVEQSLNERSFAIKLTNNYTLLFKLYGNRSNIVLFEGEEVHSIFNHNFEADYGLSLNGQHRELPQTWEAFEEAEGNISQVFPTFGKVVQKYLADYNYESLSTEVKWGVIQELLQGFEEDEKYYITEYKGKVILSLLEVGEVLEVCTKPIDALNAYYRAFARDFYLNREREQLHSELQKKINKSKKYIQTTQRNLEKLEKAISPREIADVLMANLHAVPQGITETELFNFYTNQKIKIKLNKELSPQKNAERYYRKAKNQSKELEQLIENITVKEELLSKLENQITLLNELEDYKSFKKFLKEQNLGKKVKQEEGVPLFKNYLFEGFQVLVGRNSRNNDELTQRYAHKSDYWLHAKDVSGSHVVIKHKAGKTIPSSVIEKAAELAAYYSKRKKDSLCPVTVTEKKYVRKVKGAPAGAVMVDREKVVMVEPRDYPTI
ncbi:MAG: DUF814 domain-containing protein [Cytophagales bacterium]|nr:DUF814 domain-containing protein [Cytophagales bacterium]